ncbi:MAG: hypothetical protein KAT77_04900 [Nanoarchaeota archaeon]|nr:hypothetical protein [Nanoarchaeota archaeon]
MRFKWALEGVINGLYGQFSYHYFPTFFRQQYNRLKKSYDSKNHKYTISSEQVLAGLGLVTLPIGVLGELFVISKFFGHSLINFSEEPSFINENFLILGAAVVGTNIISAGYELIRKYTKKEEKEESLADLFV